MKKLLREKSQVFRDVVVIDGLSSKMIIAVCFLTLVFSGGPIFAADGDGSAPNNPQPVSTAAKIEVESLGRALTDYEKTHTIQKKDAENSEVARQNRVKVGNNVKFHVLMKLENGAVVFDSARDGRPWSGKVGDGSILSGIDLGIRGMTEGSKRQIWIPPHMGYGANGIQPQVPPNSKLYVEVDLISIDEPDATK